KQDVLEAARSLREQQAAAGAPRAAAAADGSGTAPAQAHVAVAAPAPQPGPVAAPAAQSRAIVPSTLRGTTERLSRARQLIARRMVEALQTSAPPTTAAEADVTAIARLRRRAQADFAAREGLKLSDLRFFALAPV